MTEVLDSLHVRIIMQLHRKERVEKSIERQTQKQNKEERRQLINDS